VPFWTAVAACIALAVTTVVLFSANRRLRNAAAPHALGAVVAFDIRPVTRGADGVQTISAPGGTAAVILRIPAETGFAGYTASLKRSGRAVWSEAMPAASVLQFVVPAAMLRPGRYEIVVQGKRPGGTAELVVDTDIDVR
jgi:hypothetical protein